MAPYVPTKMKKKTKIRFMLLHMFIARSVKYRMNKYIIISFFLFSKNSKNNKIKNLKRKEVLCKYF